MVLVIEQKKKQFEDGKIINEALLEASDALLDNFKSKGKIIVIIKFIQFCAEQ